MPENVSDAAVFEATGKSIQEWLTILDNQNMKNESHKAIVVYLTQSYPSLSPWWVQTIANLYEKHLGNKVTGLTETGGFEIGVRKILKVDSNLLWNFVISKPGMNIIIGDFEHPDGRTDDQLSEGLKISSNEGIEVEIRVIKPFSHIRMKWKLPEWDRPSTLQIRVIPGGAGKTTLSFHQENLDNLVIRETMRTHWQNKMREIESLLKN